MDPAPPPPAVESRFVDELLGGLAVVAISLGLLLIPVVHFVAGPLGPGIGAFIMASRIRPGGRGVLVISVLAGVGFALLLAGAITALTAFTVTASPMQERPADWQALLTRPGIHLFIAAIGGGWGTLLALLGALAGTTAGRSAGDGT